MVLCSEIDIPIFRYLQYFLHGNLGPPDEDEKF